MEQKSALFSALGVGVGLGVGLASGRSLGRWANGLAFVEDGLTGEQIEQELMRQITDGKKSTVTFDEFPYFLSKTTRELLTSAAYVHLKDYDISKHTRNLAPASKAILLSGPSEFYHQNLAKALSHHFESNLLLLDITDFSMKIQKKYGCTKREPFHKRSISELTLDKMSSFMAAYIPVRELIQQERLKDQERKKKEEAGKSTEEPKLEEEAGKSTEAPKQEREAGKNMKESKQEEEAGKNTKEPKKEEEAGASEETVITLRPLNMEDMRKAKNQVGASFASEGEGMKELQEWNDLYGEGGSREKEHLTYFL